MIIKFFNVSRFKIRQATLNNDPIKKHFILLFKKIHITTILCISMYCVLSGMRGRLFK